MDDDPVSLSVLAQRLEDSLQVGFGVSALSRIAYRFYMDHIRELTPEMQQTVIEIVVMEEGEEFELTEPELRDLLQTLRSMADPRP